MNLQININKLDITVFILLFTFSFIGACQEQQSKMTPQEMLLRGIYELDHKIGYELVQQAINLGTDIDFKDTYDNTALILAAINGNKEMIQLLLNAGANPDIKNKDNLTALDLAQLENDNEIIQILENEQKKRSEAVKKEAGEYLPKVLAEMVSEYFVSCPSRADKDTLVDNKKTL